MHITVGKRTHTGTKSAAYRALEYVDIAAQTEPASVFNAFLGLKIHLLQQDSRAAGDQIKAMLSCEDFSHEILRASMLCRRSMHGAQREPMFTTCWRFLAKFDCSYSTSQPS